MISISISPFESSMSILLLAKSIFVSFSGFVSKFGVFSVAVVVAVVVVFGEGMFVVSLVSDFTLVSSVIVLFVILLLLSLILLQLLLLLLILVLLFDVVVIVVLGSSIGSISQGETASTVSPLKIIIKI